jgi:hypothetical protein
MKRWWLSCVEAAWNATSSTCNGMISAVDGAGEQLTRGALVFVFTGLSERSERLQWSGPTSSRSQS